MIEQLSPLMESLTKDKALENMHSKLNKGTRISDNSVKETILNETPEKRALKEMHERIETFIDETSKQINENSPYSLSINSSIRNLKELEVYKQFNLKESNINNRDCLIKDDVDLNRKDDFERTNLERMSSGLSPLDRNNNSLDLHHIGQKEDSPLAELTKDEHHSNFSKLHINQESEIDRKAFDKERQEHWKSRAQILGGQNA